MIQLIINEWKKVFSRKSNVIIMIFIVGLAALFSFMPLIFSDEQTGDITTNSDDWQSEVSQHVAELEVESEEIASSNDELTFDESLTVSMNQSEIQRLRYHLEEGIEPPAANNLYTNLVDASSLNALIGIFVTIIASAMVSKEFSMGTIKLLLIRTQSRTKILTSKYITTILLAFFYYGLLYLSTAIFSLVSTDINPTSEYVFMTMSGNYDLLFIYQLFQRTRCQQSLLSGHYRNHRLYVVDPYQKHIAVTWDDARRDLLGCRHNQLFGIENGVC